MNYLAHAWLSGPRQSWILGGFLGDHVRGRRWRDYPSDVGLGIVLHRRVDGFVDDHPAFVACRERFEPPFRRFAGILLDLAFDHVLARNWSQYNTVALQAFADSCYQILDRHRRMLPSTLRRFSAYARDRNLLARYREPAVIAAALGGISQRLSRDNPLDRGWDAIEPMLPRIEVAFEQLAPDLAAFATHQRTALAAGVSNLNRFT